MTSTAPVRRPRGPSWRSIEAAVTIGGIVVALLAQWILLGDPTI